MVTGSGMTAGSLLGRYKGRYIRVDIRGVSR